MAEFSAFEVSSILKVADQASAPMTRVLGLARDLEREFERLKELGAGLFSGTGVNRFVTQLGRVDPALDRIATEMGAMRDASVAALEQMDTSLVATTDLVRGLSAQLADAAAATKAMRLPIPAGAGGGGRRGGGEEAGSGESDEGGRKSSPWFAGGGGMSTETKIGLAAGGAAAFGAWEESKIRDTAARALFLSGEPLSANMTHTEQFAALRKQMLDVYTLTGASLEEIESATLGTVKLMAGFPLEKRMQVLNTALTFGAQENRLNPRVSVEQGAEALVGLLHMTGQYDPQQIAKLTPKIAALSTVTNLPLSTVMRAASYSMPIAQANLGVDADQILLLITAMQRAGITNTKSGTWLREAITKTVTDTFTLTKHGSAAQKLGLQELGLLDRAGKSTVIDTAGHLDLMKEMQILNEARQRLQGPEFLKSMRQAFGAQGSEGWAVLTEPQVIQQLPQLQKWMTQMPGGEQLFNDLAGASSQQLGKDTLAEFNRSLMDIGSTALPAVNDALKVFDATLHHLNQTLEEGGVPSGASEHLSSWAALTGGALLLSPKLRRGALWAARKVLGLGGDAATGAAAGSGAAVAGGAAAAGSFGLGPLAIGTAGVLGTGVLGEAIERWTLKQFGISDPTGFTWQSSALGAQIPIPYWGAEHDDGLISSAHAQTVGNAAIKAVPKETTLDNKTASVTEQIGKEARAVLAAIGDWLIGSARADKVGNVASKAGAAVPTDFKGAHASMDAHFGQASDAAGRLPQISVAIDPAPIAHSVADAIKGMDPALIDKIVKAIDRGFANAAHYLGGAATGATNTARRPPSSASMIDPRFSPLYPALP